MAGAEVVGVVGAEAVEAALLATIVEVDHICVSMSGNVSTKLRSKPSVSVSELRLIGGKSVRIACQT